MNCLTIKSKLKPLWLLLTITVSLGALYIIIIPPWQSPDEPTHYEYAAVLARSGRFWDPQPDPDLQEQVIASLDRHDYWRWVGVKRPYPLPTTFRTTPFLSAAPSQIGKNPPGYYLPASLVIKIFAANSLLTRFYALRALSLIFSLLTVVMVFLCAREIFPDNRYLCQGSAAMAAFLPQFLVIGTSVSPDPLINLFGAVLIYFVIRFQQSGISPGRFLWLCLIFGVGLLVSYKFLILLPPLVLSVWLCLPAGGARGFFSLKTLLRAVVIVLIIILGYSLLVWYFPQIARLFLMRIIILFSTLYNFFTGLAYYPQGYWGWFNRELFKSFWLKYGWMKFELPAGFYLFLQFFSLGALAGNILFLIKWFRGRSKLSSGQRRGILILIIYALATLGAYYLFWGLRGGASTTAQGRHLFIALPAWSILFVFGWTRLFPGRWRQPVISILTALFLALGLFSLFGSIVPVFH